MSALLHAAGVMLLGAALGLALGVLSAGFATAFAFIRGRGL